MTLADCGHPLEWWGLYRQDIDIWHPDAMSHPAKMAPALCHRILDHLEELGLLRAGDKVLDPMAGISTTGLVAASRGYKSWMVELEKKFVELSQKNKTYLSKKLCLSGFELPLEIIQGDARKLSELLGERRLIGITSPPFGPSGSGERGFSNDPRPGRSYKINDDYGSTTGQIGKLKDK